MTTAVKNGSDLDGDEFLPNLDVEPDVDPAAELDGGASTATSILDLPLFLVLMVALSFINSQPVPLGTVRDEASACRLLVAENVAASLAQTSWQ